MKRRDLPPYLEDRVERGADCWPWRGPILGNGYGLANLPGRRVLAHRAVYEVLVGPIPDGRHLDHQCHNRDKTCRAAKACRHRRCVNPDHLEPATPGENVRRGRTNPAANLAKTTCPEGHEYDLTDPRGWRACSTCKKSKAEARRRAVGVKPSIAGGSACGKGHPFTPANTRWSFGKRYCKECDRLSGQKWHDKVRRPCRGCGGPKDPGRSRAYCDGCQPKKSRKRTTGPRQDVVDLVYDRASHSCEICTDSVGDRRGVDHHVHHRRPRAAGGSKRTDTNLPSNLLLLCPPCHAQVESHRGLAQSMGWLVVQGVNPATVAVLVQRDRFVYFSEDGRYLDHPPSEEPQP